MRKKGAAGRTSSQVSLAGLALLLSLFIAAASGLTLAGLFPRTAREDPSLLLTELSPSPTPPVRPSPLPSPAAPTAQRTPAPPPANPRPRVAVVQIGWIEIPKIGLRHPIYEGVTLTVIDRGPGHWPGTALPGEAGNAVFAGHRVTHTRPFRYIDQLSPGDLIIFHMPYGDFTYSVTEHLVVTPKDVWIVNQTRDPTVTLFACHPPGSARYRYVVRGKLVQAGSG